MQWQYRNLQDGYIDTTTFAIHIHLKDDYTIRQ